MFPTVIERIVRAYALEMERFEREEQIYRLAVEKIQKVYRPPVDFPDALTDAEVDINKFSALRFGWAAKLLFRMLKKLPDFRVAEFASRFLNEFDMQGWTDEFCDVFWDRCHVESTDMTTELCSRMNRVVVYWRMLNRTRHGPRFGANALFGGC